MRLEAEDQRISPHLRVLLCCSVPTVCSVTARRASPKRWRTPSPSTRPPTCGRSSSPRTSPTRPWCPPTSTTTRLQSEWQTAPVKEAQTMSARVCVRVWFFDSQHFRLCFRFSFEREGSPAELYHHSKDPKPGACQSNSPS